LICTLYVYIGMFISITRLDDTYIVSPSPSLQPLNPNNEHGIICQQHQFLQNLENQSLSMGLFNHDSGNTTCPMPTNLVAGMSTIFIRCSYQWKLIEQIDAAEPIFGNWSFHKFNMTLSGACAAFSSISIFILMARHAMHYSKPNEQSK
jgi:hypothetical protein